MIYFLYGDPNKIFKKANSIIDTLLKKNSGSNLLKIDSDNWKDFNVDEIIGGQSLFTIKQIVYLKKLFENKESAETLIKRIKEISESNNIFIIAEESLDKKTFSKIEKVSEKVQNFDIKKVAKERENLFDITEALGNRDPKKTWTLYQKRIRKIRPEEIHGILWWQIKTMLIARKTKNAQEAGLKPFVFSKAQRFNNNYSQKEVEKMSNEMIDMLQKSRRDGPDLETSLEKFVLSI